MAFPTTGVLDNFNRTDANPLDGSWTNGWWGDGNPKIVSNQFATQAGGGWAGAYYNAATYGDCEAYATISTVNNFIIAGRIGGTLTSPNCYYLFYTHAVSELRIKKLIAGADSTLGSVISATFASGDKVGLELFGNTITAYQYTAGAWSALGNRTDTSYTSGYLAIELDNSTARFDDFGGGTIVANSTNLLSGKFGMKMEGKL
jgi:hypothetical protein